MDNRNWATAASVAWAEGGVGGGVQRNGRLRNGRGLDSASTQRRRARLFTGKLLGAGDALAADACARVTTTMADRAEQQQTIE